MARNGFVRDANAPNKLYTDSKDPSYTYTPDGQLAGTLSPPASSFLTSGRRYGLLGSIGGESKKGWLNGGRKRQAGSKHDWNP